MPSTGGLAEEDRRGVSLRLIAAQDGETFTQ
jgi:hypothetical protein